MPMGEYIKEVETSPQNLYCVILRAGLFALSRKWYCKKVDGEIHLKRLLSNYRGLFAYQSKQRDLLF